jgi:cell surface protein SprA
MSHLRIVTKYLAAGSFILLSASVLINDAAFSFPSNEFNPGFGLNFQLPDTSSEKHVELKYPFKEDPLLPSSDMGKISPLFLKNPSNISSNIEYDPESNTYTFSEKVGKFNYRPTTYMTFDEYRQFELNEAKRYYWQERRLSESTGTRTSFIPSFKIGGEAFDKVFGTNTINIIPQGSAELIFGFNLSRIDNPTLSEKLRKTPSFTFEEKIQMNVTGSIGDKMKLGLNYNTEATFEFENKTKIEYAGKEDEIIKKIEAGNVSLPLTGSLITGSQSLFGLKTELQFGKLSVTSIFSQQEGETSVIDVQGGAQLSEFQVSVDDYDANRHFFLSQYFKDNYDRSLQNLPVINTGVNITKIEVWVTNKTSNFEYSRNVVALMDLAEGVPNIFSGHFTQTPGERGTNPRNELNTQYREMTTIYNNIRDINLVTSTLQGVIPNFLDGQDYEKVENARKLSEREYTLNSKLGFISLNSALNADEILCVAYEYTMSGRTYKVGELSSDGIDAPNTLIVKLLKGTNLTPRLPTWELMMKNIYAIGAYQVNPKDFTLEVVYQDDKTGTSINYLPEGAIANKVLLSVLNLDNLNEQLDPVPDGMFDFISGITIVEQNGRIIFPVLKPFGEYLAKKINDPVVAAKYVFNELYDSTKTIASQVAEKNKFWLTGAYKSSSSSEIMLNAMNVPQGSVVVTAGGRQLTENVDYTVDYTLGRVTIINQGLLESGTPIKISLESQSLFSIQTKTLLGTHLDYKFSDDLNIGGTVLNLTERPLTQKVNIGDEPISNTIWGLNGSYRTNSQFLTTLLDRLPLISTKEPSTITMAGEFANLIPGHSRAIKKEGTAYIDDFEASQTSIDMKNFAAWVHSSTPSGRFEEGKDVNNRIYGFNRAKLAFYVIDPLFLRNNSLTPAHLKANPNSQSSHFVEEVFETDIFPNKENPSGVPTNIAVLNVAFYPREKGPYNYTTEIDENGLLTNPERRWGGIMREIQTNDFETANVEFIEFWLMDPFVEEPDHGGGDLYFNLGDISEDILSDSRKAFENGLPSSAEVTLVDTTVWGRVPITQSLVNAFNNDLQSRQYQDVGLDGLGDKDENSFFKDYLDSIRVQYGDNSKAYKDALNDVSNDDFHYFRGTDYDQAEVGILDRYRNYNGLEGNSPTSEMSKEDYPTTGSTLPNVEDINRDNTLSEKEKYYEYHVSLRPRDMVVGKNYITDMVSKTSDFPNGEKSNVNWYQFRIPVHDWDASYGGIQDFKSIRFMRMYLNGFEQAVILRFAKLDLVRGEWRRYNFPLTQGGEGTTSPEPADGVLDVSAVNIEENAGKTPVNYVLPPGITRVIDPTNPQLRQLNEQSLLMKVQDLEDGDARAVYKNIYMDIRQYKKIQMEVHAEALEDVPLNDNDLVAFIRLGTDYKNNYYEYEVPLKLTLPGRYDNDNPSDQRIVWPAENRFEISLEIFQDIKQTRNDAMRASGSTIDMNTIYTDFDGKGNRISIKGNPNLSNVKTIMLGIRNPKASANPQEDDGMPKSGEIWLNELRLTDFNEDGGWAANARITTKLADLGTVTISGNTSTPGFGSIEKKVNERSKEEVYQYDISSNFELGKIFPDKAQVSIPLYVGFSETRVNPQYNPLDPDIPLKSALRNAETEAERKEIKYNAQEYVRRKSMNLTNIRKNKLEGPARFYDIANWALSYSYNESSARDIKTEYDMSKNYRGALSYSFNARPKNVTPFAKVNIFKSQWLRLLKDFNFYYSPSRLSFRTDINRTYDERLLRNLTNPSALIDTIVNKNFLWNRYFDLKYDLTRSLKLDFSSTNITRIDEPTGVVRKGQPNFEEKKDSILQEFYNGGRTTHYEHSINVTYTLPINKIPLLDWVTLSARYGANYYWDVGPITADTIDLGNIIKNSASTQLNGQLNLINLYNKVPYLKKVNQRFKSEGGRQPSTEKRTREVNYNRDGIFLRAGEPRSVSHNLKTEDVEVKFFDATGQEIQGTVDVLSENRISFTTDKDYRGVRCEVKGTIELGENPLILIADYTTKILMAVRNVSISYTSSDGSLLPGYKPSVSFAGMERFGGNNAPGLPFILGFQDPDFPYRAIENGWLSKDSLLNTPYIMNHTTTFNFRGTVEPLPTIRIDLTANRSYTENLNEYFIADVNGNFPDSTRSRQLTGNFTMSYITWGTAFEKVYSKKNLMSASFEKFKNEYRLIISERLAMERAKGGDYIPKRDSAGFYYGYGGNSQDVLIPAFLAAYGKKDPHKIGLSPFPSLARVLPNWRIQYDGLTKIPFLSKLFRSVSITHSYRSSYSVGSFISNPFYLQDENGLVDLSAIDLDRNFLPENDIVSVSINEQFSPLINIDMSWQNNLTTRFEVKRSRSLALSLSNNQLNEVSSSEIVIGGGYRFNEVPLVFNLPGGGQKSFTSDLNLMADVSIRDNRTMIRKLVENIDQATAGQRVFKINITLDYALSSQFNLRLFFDRVMNDPIVSLAYRTANTNVGFSLRFTLAQ